MFVFLLLFLHSSNHFIGVGGTQPPTVGPTVGPTQVPKSECFVDQLVPGLNCEYVKRSIGNCNEDRLSFIHDADECEKASVYLRLADQIKNDARSPDNPYGCYFKDGSILQDGAIVVQRRDTRLWMNPNGTTEDDDEWRVSICKADPIPSLAPTTTAPTPNPTSSPTASPTVATCPFTGYAQIDDVFSSEDCLTLIAEMGCGNLSSIQFCNTTCCFTESPTATPTISPTQQPTSSSSGTPSLSPTTSPTISPTQLLTPLPSATPPVSTTATSKLTPDLTVSTSSSTFTQSSSISVDVGVTEASSQATPQPTTSCCQDDEDKEEETSSSKSDSGSTIIIVVAVVLCVCFALLLLIAFYKHKTHEPEDENKPKEPILSTAPSPLGLRFNSSHLPRQFQLGHEKTDSGSTQNTNSSIRSADFPAGLFDVKENSMKSNQSIESGFSGFGSEGNRSSTGSTIVVNGQSHEYAKIHDKGSLNFHETQRNKPHPLQQHAGRPPSYAEPLPCNQPIISTSKKSTNAVDDETMYDIPTHYIPPTNTNNSNVSSDVGQNLSTGTYEVVDEPQTQPLPQSRIETKTVYDVWVDESPQEYVEAKVSTKANNDTAVFGPSYATPTEEIQARNNATTYQNARAVVTEAKKLNSPPRSLPFRSLYDQPPHTVEPETLHNPLYVNAAVVDGIKEPGYDIPSTSSVSQWQQQQQQQQQHQQQKQQQHSKQQRNVKPTLQRPHTHKPPPQQQPITHTSMSGVWPSELVKLSPKLVKLSPKQQPNSSRTNKNAHDDEAQYETKVEVGIRDEYDHPPTTTLATNPRFQIGFDYGSKTQTVNNGVSPTGDSIKEFKEDSKDADKPHTYINGSTTENMSDTSKHTYINDINDTNDTNETENKTDVTVAADGYSTLAEIITQESKGHHHQQQPTTCQPPPPQYSLPPVSSPLPPSTTSTMSASDGIIVKNEQYATLPLTLDLTPPPVVSIQTQPLPDNQSDTSINQSDTSINQSDTSINQSDILIQPNPEYDLPSLILQSTPSSTTTVGDVAYMLLPTKSQSQKQQEQQQQELYDIRKSLSTISKAKEPVFTLPTPTPGTPIITSTVIDRSADEIQAFTYDSLDSNIDADAGLRDSDPGQWNGDLSM